MNPREIADFFEKLWFKKSGRNAAILAVTVALFPLFLTYLNVLWSLVWTIAMDFGVIGLWLLAQQPPVTPANKIGFLICISCVDDLESEKLQEDFIRPLRELIKSGKTGYVFHVMVIPQHIASTIQDIEEAQALRIKVKAQFMIFGRVRLREIDGKETHIFDLEGLVAHNPVPEHISQFLAQEFTELMPRKLHIPTENDLLSFQFTSEWADAVARYIIGFALAISGDWDYAEALYLNVKNNLRDKPTKFPVYTKLKERLPIRISELYQARAMVKYTEWVESKDSEFLIQSEIYLQHLAPIHQEAKEIWNLKSIIAFVLRGNVEEALKQIKMVKPPRAHQWHLNMAFLLGYQGQLKNSIRHYRIAAEQIEIPPEILSQIEDFIIWVLKNEPSKHQLYYCLGFFNWKIKGDLVSAIRDFESFLANNVIPGIEKEKELAKNWVTEINQLIANTYLSPSSTPPFITPIKVQHVA
ncbi:MAG: hypothetical protein ABL869_01725 [Candidatus Nitrotoga sp.]